MPPPPPPPPPEPPWLPPPTRRASRMLSGHLLPQASAWRTAPAPATCLLPSGRSGLLRCPPPYPRRAPASAPRSPPPLPSHPASPRKPAVRPSQDADGSCTHTHSITDGGEVNGGGGAADLSALRLAGRDGGLVPHPLRRRCPVPRRCSTLRLALRVPGPRRCRRLGTLDRRLQPADGTGPVLHSPWRLGSGFRAALAGRPPWPMCPAGMRFSVT